MHWGGKKNKSIISRTILNNLKRMRTLLFWLTPSFSTQRLFHPWSTAFVLNLTIDSKNIPLKQARIHHKTWLFHSKNLRDYDAYWFESKSKDKHSGTKIPLKFCQVILCIWLFPQTCWDWDMLKNFLRWKLFNFSFLAKQNMTLCS